MLIDIVMFRLVFRRRKHYMYWRHSPLILLLYAFVIHCVTPHAHDSNFRFPTFPYIPCDLTTSSLHVLKAY